MPALLALCRIERQRQQNRDADNRRNQNERCLHLRRQIGEYGVNPEEEEIRLGYGLDDRRIGLTRRTIRSEDEGAHSHCSDHCTREDEILPEGAGNERNAVFMSEAVVLLYVGCT